MHTKTIAATPDPRQLSMREGMAHKLGQQASGKVNDSAVKIPFTKQQQWLDHVFVKRLKVAYIRL